MNLKEENIRLIDKKHQYDPIEGYFIQKNNNCVDIFNQLLQGEENINQNQKLQLCDKQIIGESSSDSIQPDYIQLFNEAHQAYRESIKIKKWETMEKKKNKNQFQPYVIQNNSKSPKKSKVISKKQEKNPWRKYSLRYPQVPLKMLCLLHGMGSLSTMDKCQARSYIVRQLSRVEAKNKHNQNFVQYFSQEYIGLLIQLQKKKQTQRKNCVDSKKQVSIGKGIEEIQLAKNVVQTYFQKNPYTALLQIYRAHQKMNKKIQDALDDLKKLRINQLKLSS